MRSPAIILLLAATLLPAPGLAQSTVRSDRGLYLTLFRSPATGIEIRSGHAAAYAGYYPTVIRSNGVLANTNFIRAGATYYLRKQGATPYISPSVVWSLDNDWKNGALTELGLRGRLYKSLNGRLGVAALTTVGRRVRVNPTVGLDLKLGSGR